MLVQNKRIKQLEEEIQHVKTSKMIDKFAHKNIHGPREKGHMSEEETHNKKVSGDNLSETTQRTEQIKKTPRVLNPVVTSCRSHILISQSCRPMMEVGIGNHTTCKLRILPCALNGQMPRNFTIFLYACEGKL